VVYRGDGLTRSDREVGDELAVRRLAARLAGLASRRPAHASPYVDGVFPRWRPIACRAREQGTGGLPDQLARLAPRGFEPWGTGSRPGRAWPVRG